MKSGRLPVGAGSRLDSLIGTGVPVIIGGGSSVFKGTKSAATAALAAHSKATHTVGKRNGIFMVIRCY